MYLDVDSEIIIFLYAGYIWSVQLQKGQYGVASGGKIIIKTPGTGEKVWSGFTLRKYGRELFTHKGFEPVLTGFLLGEWSDRRRLSMDVEFSFPNADMCDAFLEGFYDTGYEKKECRIVGNTVYFNFTTPKSKQKKSIGKWYMSISGWWSRCQCKK